MFLPNARVFVVCNRIKVGFVYAVTRKYDNPSEWIEIDKNLFLSTNHRLVSATD